MASIGTQDRMDNATSDNNSVDAENLWSSILGEVQSSSASKLSTKRSLLVLGDNESGKTTLIAKLQGVEEPKKGAGLEYYYIDVRDDYRDEQARLNVWVLDGDSSHRGLMRYALTEESLPDTLVLLVASMAAPWSLAAALERWATVLTQHIDKLRIPSDTRREYEESVVRSFQDYMEAGDGGVSPQTPVCRHPNPLHPAPLTTEDQKVVLPLGDNVLTHNLGIPIVVVLTKSDSVSTLEKEHDFREEHFDFIQQYVRKFCLKYGAALFYTSVRDERNCELLYRYLVHRIYGFPFSSPAHVVERDSIFVPSGWDNEKKISILYENMTTVKSDDHLEDVIVKPIMRKPVQREQEIVAEEEQTFLVKMQAVLASQPAAGAGNSPSPAGEGTPPRTSRPPTQRTPGERGGGAHTSPLRGKVAPDHDKGGAAGGPGAEGMLATFFNSLLNKKTASPGATKDKAAVSRDAAAELERMRGKKGGTPDANHDTNHAHTGASGS